MAKKKTAHVVPHTHWDREWRYPIWQNRSLLVDFMDELLDTLEKNPDYKQFNMDGQSVVFEDYLLVRPEKREQLEKFIKEGRITAGPWYTLPDLYPLDGECLVRNLLKGYRVSEKLGKTMKMAYTSFGWGQTAQFPQIYKSFGMDFCITAKRVSDERAPKSEFWWEAPDGSRILTTKLGPGGRSYLFEFGIQEARRGRDNDKNMHYIWNEGGLIYHKANAGEENVDHFIYEDNLKLYPEKVAENFEKTWKSTDTSVSENERLFLLGIDFSVAESDADKMLEIANAEIPDKEFKFSTLDDYISALKEDINTDDLVTVYGELRDGPAPACSGNGLTARMYIKQKNKQIQNKLIYKAEPLMAAMLMTGSEYDTSFSNLTWDFLLKSHPHDSINGVTQDKTANDEMYHLAQAEELTDVLYQRGMRDYLRKLDLSSYDKDDVLLVIYNPLPFDRSEIMKVSVDYPYEREAWDLAVYDDEGNRVALQQAEIQERVMVGIHDPQAQPMSMPVDRHIFYMETGVIPAGGCRVYKVETNRPMERSFTCGLMYSETSTGKEIAKTDTSMENEYIKFEANPNGTIKITDKVNYKVYDNMHCFEDIGEVGDYWINLEPHRQKIFTSAGLNADIWLEDNGELSATIAIRQVMRLPAEGIRPHCFRGANSKRSEIYKDMEIISYFTLNKGERKVNVRVELDNTIKDHRLRVLYPTGIKAEHSYAAGHFNVDKRPVMPLDDNSAEYFKNMQTLPHQTFVDVTDEKTGVAFINNCLTEYELKNDGMGTLALTLLKSVKNTICTAKKLNNEYPEQNGGQCLGRHTYEYAICPHSGNWQTGNIYNEAQRFNITPAAMQTAVHTHGYIASGTSMYSVSENLVMTALKKAEDRNSVILRAFNPSDNEVDAEIKFMADVKNAYLVTMNEERIEAVDITKPIKVGGHKIITLELEV